MGRAPDDDKIANFVAFTGADQYGAVEFLTQEANLEKAVQNWFEAQERGTSSYGANSGWNEDDMHAGKEYGPETNPQNSYQIHSVDNAQTLGPEIFSNSLSRPNSRVDGKLDDKEDSNFQQGLLNSVTHSRHENSTTSFRPAHGDHYPPHQWSMVTTSHNIIPDPEPKQRARMISSPAFIKPTTDDNRLPSLLTIYQQIPMACEALLARHHVRTEYGTSKDWWQGDPIRSRGIVSLDGNQPVEVQTPVMDEVQRLMAFLELTDRAYGSCDALMEAVNQSRHRPWTSDLSADAHLLPTWLEECVSDHANEELRDIFTTAAFERASGNIINDPNFQVFILSLRYDLDGTPSLYDLVDEVMWGTWIVDNPTELTIKPGHILTFQYDQGFKNSGLMEWPLVWYADRYLEENKQKALDMLHEQARIEDERTTIQMQQNKLEQVTYSATKKPIAATDLLKVVKPFLCGERPPIDPLERRDEAIAAGAEYHPLDEYQKLGKMLQEVADEILQKHEVLEQTKNQLTSHKRKITDFLKGYSGAADDKPTHRYTLRGVSTDQNTTYILANPNTSDDLLETDVNNWDWWRIHWDAQSDNPADLRKVDESSVLEAARKATVVTTVYASDKAINYPRQPLPISLKNFARADNLHFEAEIDNPELSQKRKVEDNDWSYTEGRGYNYGSQSRNSSLDSMAANMDAEMQEQWDSNNDETHPPSYSSTPPPIPPRTGEKGQAPSRSLIEDDEDNLMEIEDNQESGTVNLMDDDTAYDQEMVEVNSPSSMFGGVPGGLTAGGNDSVTTDGLPEADKRRAQTQSSN